MLYLPDEPETIFSLRQKFAEYCKPGAAHRPALKTICMVGALNAPSGVPCYELDKVYLNLTLMKLQKNNIAVDPEFEIEIENIDPAEGGKDFLERTKPADMVILCCLFNPPASNPVYITHPPAGRFSISKRHFEQSAWHDAAVRVGAKIIAVMGEDNSTELGPARFMPANDNSAFVRLDPPRSRNGDDFLYLHLLRHRSFI